ncbi:MAG: GNAT family N-acetyltransferase [Bacteroidales bacterium]
MRILVDTNILINLEDNKIIDKLFSKFYNLAITNNCKIWYHPSAIPQDIYRDKDEERRNIILSKLEKYEKLSSPAELTPDFLIDCPSKKQNDVCDNQQLYQLHKGYVDLFVTQDRGILKKAQKLGIDSTCIDIEQAVQFLSDNYKIVIPKHPILSHQSIRTLESEFSSRFFDSLREDYNAELFERWLHKCVIENRQCYYVKSENNLLAILIYNEERIEEHKIPDIYEKVLKICTLKVANSLFGLKIGELFLQKMFEYCLNQELSYLYLTVYERQVHLVSLLEKFGFKKEIFTNRQGLQEMRMIKLLNRSLINLTTNDIEYHPFYTDKCDIGKFVIPIQPRFYNALFKDGQLRNPTLFDQFSDSVNEIQGNSIMKAYVSSSRRTGLKQGDILFFYASKKNQVIEPIGILESQQIVDDFDTLWDIVRKKTVFSPEQLREMLNDKGKLYVITFRLISYLNKPIKLKEIQMIDSFKNKIQTITRLKEDDYLKLKANGYFDKCYIVN